MSSSFFPPLPARPDSAPTGWGAFADGGLGLIDPRFEAGDGGSLRDGREARDAGGFRGVFAEIVGDLGTAARFANGIGHGRRNGEVRVVGDLLEIRRLLAKSRRCLDPGLVGGSRRDFLRLSRLPRQDFGAHLARGLLGYGSRVVFG